MGRSLWTMLLGTLSGGMLALCAACGSGSFTEQGSTIAGSQASRAVVLSVSGVTDSQYLAASKGIAKDAGDWASGGITPGDAGSTDDEVVVECGMAFGAQSEPNGIVKVVTLTGSPSNWQQDCIDQGVENVNSCVACKTDGIAAFHKWTGSLHYHTCMGACYGRAPSNSVTAQEVLPLTLRFTSWITTTMVSGGTVSAVVRHDILKSNFDEADISYNGIMNQLDLSGCNGDQAASGEITISLTDPLGLDDWLTPGHSTKLFEVEDLGTADGNGEHTCIFDTFVDASLPFTGVDTNAGEPLAWARGPVKVSTKWCDDMATGCDVAPGNTGTLADPVLRDALGAFLPNTTDAMASVLLLDFDEPMDAQSVVQAGKANVFAVQLPVGVQQPDTQTIVSPEDDLDGIVKNNFAVLIADAYRYQLLPLQLNVSGGMVSQANRELTTAREIAFTAGCALSDEFYVDSRACWGVADHSLWAQPMTVTDWSDIQTMGLVSSFIQNLLTPNFSVSVPLADEVVMPGGIEPLAALGTGGLGRHALIVSDTTAGTEESIRMTLNKEMGANDDFAIEAAIVQPSGFTTVNGSDRDSLLITIQNGEGDGVVFGIAATDDGSGAVQSCIAAKLSAQTMVTGSMTLCGDTGATTWFRFSFVHDTTVARVELSTDLGQTWTDMDTLSPLPGLPSAVLGTIPELAGLQSSTGFYGGILFTSAASVTKDSTARIDTILFEGPRSTTQYSDYAFGEW